MKNSILTVLAGLGAMTQINADECTSCFESNYRAGDPLDPCCVTAGYPYPATTELCGWDFYVDGEWIYWKFGNATTDFWGFRVSTAGTPTTTEDLTFNESYQSGFRVGAGVDLGPVVFDVRYTRWSRDLHQNFTAGTNEVLRLGIPGINTANLSSVSHKDNMTMNWLDATVVKPIYVGERMTLDLNYGLLTSWMTRKKDIAAIQTNTIPGTVTSDDKMWTTGPEVGIRSKGLMNWGFYVEGSFAGSLQYGKWTTNKSTVYFSNIANINANASYNNQSMHFLYPYVDSKLGLGWQSYFCDDWHVDIVATYEVLFMSPGPHSAPGGVGGQPYRSMTGDFHGFSIAGKIDF